MNKRSGYKATFLMALVPLVILLFVSCSSTPEKISLDDETTGQWNTAVEKTIVQPQRAAKLKALGQQLIDVSNSIQQDIGAFNEKAMMLNEKYDASNEELQQLVVEFSEKPIRNLLSIVTLSLPCAAKSAQMNGKP